MEYSPWLFVARPEGGFYGSTGENRAIFGMVRQRYAFTITGENHSMFSYDRTSAEGLNANVRLGGVRRCSRLLVRTAFSCNSALRPSAAACASINAVPEGASTLWRWCISTISMSKSSSRAAATLAVSCGEKVDPQAHVSGFDDAGSFRCFADRCFVFGP